MPAVTSPPERASAVFKRWIVLVATIAGVLLLSDRAQSRATSGMARQLHAYEQLSDGIAQLLATPQLHATKFGIAVYSLDRDTLIVAHNVHEPLVPASLTKLYYTATAFATMGPRYAIRTVLATDGVLRDGTLEGNLYIIGHGDCLLASADLEALADRLVALGIKRITGAIVADATHFDPITDRQQYSGDAERMENLPPITALGIDGNRFTVIVTRGAGDRVRVHTLPASSGVVVQWAALPKPSSQPAPRIRSKKRIRQRYGDRIVQHRGRRRTRAVTIEPVRISSALRTDGVQEIRIVGKPRPNASVSFAVTMLDPPLATAGALERSLAASGIRIEGGIRRGAAPQNARELTAWERPLQDLVTVCNKNSDNFIAEHVMKILGAYCCGNTQCNVHAYRTVTALLDSLGIRSEGCVLFDGSGLSRRNRVTVASLLGLLRYCARQNWGDVFFQSLAIAGCDGTLARRMKGTAADSNLRGKTGTHRNVSGLAGMVRSASGERFLFAVLWNGNSVGLYKRLENQLGELLASFGSVEPASSVGSSPSR
ncbi:D-alanyl-D-alanine carboxypeptidase DacC [bacterium HR20]|nr:D-alanyl-D-alanine carboxypeptidase DacC [bacterium HR20]